MLEDKLALLKEYIAPLRRAAVAFSGGTDSALLALVTKEVLQENAFAITIWSPLLSAKDKTDIFDFTETHGIALIRVDFDETRDADFCMNTPERCYFCKASRIKAIEDRARTWDIPWILDGSNVDDLGDFRPGMRALKESACVKSPLLECGFSKAEIREASRLYGLTSADKPAAACLASRVPTGTKIDADIVSVIERGEDILREYLPDNTQLRLRYDGHCGKIETELKAVSLIQARIEEITAKLKNIGVDTVSVDEDGYKTGKVTKKI